MLPSRREASLAVHCVGSLVLNRAHLKVKRLRLAIASGFRIGNARTRKVWATVGCPVRRFSASLHRQGMTRLSSQTRACPQILPVSLSYLWNVAGYRDGRASKERVLPCPHQISPRFAKRPPQSFTNLYPMRQAELLLLRDFLLGQLGTEEAERVLGIASPRP